MRVHLEVPTAKLERIITSYHRQLEYASSKTIWDIAQNIKKEERFFMENIFDRPTPWTLNSLYTARVAYMTSAVGIKSDSFGYKGTAAGQYLKPQVYGGTRPQKRMEKWLKMYAGMPANLYVVPGRGARLDQYGNMSRGQLIQILSYLQAHPDSYAWTTPRSLRRNKKPRKYFVVAGGNAAERRLHPGVYWERGPRDIIPVLLFVRMPIYRKRFPFFEIGERVFKRDFARLFGENRRDALASMR